MSNQVEAGLERMVKRFRSTWREPNSVKLDMDYFANVVDVGFSGLAICTDGIGSKAMIATMLDKYDTVGIDCVAMNANDLVCVGATPLVMVDYIALQSPKIDILDRIAIGLTEGAQLAGIAIVGGETAVLSDIISGFDLAGTAVGLVPVDQIIYGRDIKEKDVLIGIESSGVHSNGLTLARTVFHLNWDYGGYHNQRVLAKKFDDLELFLGAELLRPTHIYVREALQLIREIKVKALIHITGGGLLNLNRVRTPVGFVLDTMPEVPPIFRLIQSQGHVEDIAMWAEFNMGIGFCAIVAETDVDQALAICRSRGKHAYRIGYTIRDDKRRIRLIREGLLGYAKHFERMT